MRLSLQESLDDETASRDTLPHDKLVSRPIGLLICALSVINLFSVSRLLHGLLGVAMHSCTVRYSAFAYVVFLNLGVLVN